MQTTKRQEILKELHDSLPRLVKIARIPKVDLHGKSKDEASQIIDRLSLSGNLVEIVTGHGKGILKALLKELQPLYGYKILSIAPNHASFVVDFS